MMKNTCVEIDNSLDFFSFPTIFVLILDCMYCMYYYDYYYTSITLEHSRPHYYE